MEKEQYVSFETSQLLKGKGFDWAVLTCYENSEFRYVNLWNWNKFGASTLCSAPTQQMACRWLREKKGIHILPEISEVKENPNYYCMIWNTTNLESFIVDLFGLYEDAVEAGIQYCLKNIIK